MTRRVITHDTLFDALYGGRRDGGPETAKVVERVTVYKLRGRMHPHGIEIKTIYGVGYEISEADQMKLRALVTTMRRDGE
jgi:DNA-binding response OmpR family regulator